MDDACRACGGAWLPARVVDALAPGRVAQLRRLAGKGPLTPHNCADCRFALKALDVSGPVHEGDLFWGLESPRPAGSCVADACARCGGVFVGAADLERAGGREAFERALRCVMLGAS